MAKIPEWQYDEFKHCGVDFSNPDEVESYQKTHQRMRDFKHETQEMIKFIGISDKDTVIDFGCGTGAFVLNAADMCGKIYAVDVSKAMLGFCKNKCKEAKISNVKFKHAGFLTYEHKAKSADVIITKLALHHLPDFWKLVALRRMATMLKKGGKLYLCDIVYSFKIKDYKKSIEKWRNVTAKKNAMDFKRRIEIHIGQEFSTTDWIMEGLLKQAGFKILKTEYKDGFFATYLCSKRN
ncbi:MAG: class I SAM-dependent methyltransferase [Planctomycetaceae bacterium]|nr:class I SAM-dependent methyltransferase [Planctomycetaceae bacterium]